MPTHRNRDKDKRKSREKPCEKESCNDNCFYITVQDEGGQTKRCSRYCHRHTCQAGVSENAQDRCLELKFKTGKLCNNHRKCGSTGCDQSGENPNQELPFFCPQHQCQRNGCLMQCYRHTGGCKDHLCARQGCPYPSDADRGGIFCRTHICRSRDCMNGTHENNGLCHAHLPCSHHGCNASRKAVDGNRRNFELHCAQHMPCQAMSCKEFAGQGHKFCIRHRCHLSDCMKQSEDGCEFCDDHTCHEPGCPLPIHIMNDSNSRYCAYHCCQIEDCFEKSSNMSGYCRSHTCEAADCLEGRVEPTRFCSKHKCQDPGCHYGAMAAGGYCHIHGCHEIDCCERAIGGPVSVQHCVEHLREQSRQAGYDEATQEHKQKEAKSFAKIEELKKEIEELKRDREELKTDNEELKRDSEVLRTDNEDLWRTIDNMRIRGAHNPESAWAYRPPESSHTPWRESAGQSRVYERPRQSRTDDIPDTYGHWPHPTQFRRGFRQ